MSKPYIVRMWTESVPEKPWFWAGTTAKNFDPAKAQRFGRGDAEKFRAAFQKNADAHAANVGLEPLHVEVVLAPGEMVPIEDAFVVRCRSQSDVGWWYFAPGGKDLADSMADAEWFTRTEAERRAAKMRAVCDANTAEEPMVVEALPYTRPH